MPKNGDIQLSPLLCYTVPMVLEHMSLKESAMAVQPDMIGIVVSDMAAALKFYRMLSLAIPEGVEGEGHVEVTSPNGYRIAWDTEEVMRGIYPDWPQPVGQRIGLAFKCDSPTEVDALYERIVASGHRGHKS